MDPRTQIKTIEMGDKIKEWFLKIAQDIVDQWTFGANLLLSPQLNIQPNHVLLEAIISLSSLSKITLKHFQHLLDNLVKKELTIWSPFEAWYFVS